MRQALLLLIPYTSRYCVPRDGPPIAPAGSICCRASGFSVVAKPPLMALPSKLIKVDLY